MHALYGDRPDVNRVSVPDGVRAALDSVLLAPEDHQAGELGCHGVVPSRVIAVLVGGQDFGDCDSFLASLLEDLRTYQVYILLDRRGARAKGEVLFISNTKKRQCMVAVGRTETSPPFVLQGDNLRTTNAHIGAQQQ